MAACARRALQTRAAGSSTIFEGRVDQTLLLHFWPLTVLIFVPQVIDSDGSNKFVGYSLAVPEVSDLESFCEDYPRLLARLPKDRRGYRPLAAVIDLPEQSALEFLQHGHSPMEARDMLDKVLAKGQSFQSPEEILQIIYNRKNA